LYWPAGAVQKAVQQQNTLAVQAPAYHPSQGTEEPPQQVQLLVWVQGLVRQACIGSCKVIQQQQERSSSSVPAGTATATMAVSPAPDPEHCQLLLQLVLVPAVMLLLLLVVWLVVAHLLGRHLWWVVAD
jgi:hypothetical protein